MGWVEQIVTAILKFLERLVSKETYATGADPDAGGVRPRFWQRVWDHRRSRSGGNSGSTG